MNQLIRELAEQAGMEPDVLDESEGVIWWLGDGDLEKFAQLVVQECINIVKSTEHHRAFAQSYVAGVDGLELLQHKIQQLQQHFEVNCGPSY